MTTNLILSKFFLNLFGVSSVKDFSSFMNKYTFERVETGNSNYLELILSNLDNINYDKQLLIKLDKNIGEYQDKISEKRDNITLKYFQYLAVLFTEIYLYEFSHNKETLITNLNEF